MKINWKTVCQTPGYLSLKKAYMNDVQKAAIHKHTRRSKKELLAKFNWIICRAKHRAYIKNVTIDVILNIWENRRTMWWFSYYSEHAISMCKIHSNSVKPMGVNGLRKAHKSSTWSTPQSVKHRVNYFLTCKREKLSKRKGKKARWTKQHREVAKRVKTYVLRKEQKRVCK